MPRTNIEPWMVLGGARIRGRRSDLGMTVRDLAIEAGTSKSTISKIERGLSCPLRPGISQRLAKALKLSSLSALYVDGRVERVGADHA
jgi:transcriptional regulator with XRE-family HTH domain